MGKDQNLRIVHCFRSPVGGIFRHVRDLVVEQSAAGHQVGILCDSSTGGALEDALFDSLLPHLALGLVRFPMRRAITPDDLWALLRTMSALRKLKPDVLHSHGAKGGSYARIIGSLLRVSGNRVALLYCPHGGTIHYDPATVRGKLFFALERLLEHMTDRLIFVSEYERDGYREKVGKPRCPTSLVYNGLAPQEFKSVTTVPDAADFLYIGMMRDLKGADLFLAAIAILNDAADKPVKARFVGDGPDKQAYRDLIRKLGIGDVVIVDDPMPAREAFTLARTVVVPSRAESMPYVVLEAIAAGKPVIATRVGGIPEIFGPEADQLIEPGNMQALAVAMRQRLDHPESSEVTEWRKAMVQRRFSVALMTRQINEAYLDCF